MTSKGIVVNDLYSVIWERDSVGKVSLWKGVRPLKSLFSGVNLKGGSYINYDTCVTLPIFSILRRDFILI